MRILSVHKLGLPVHLASAGHPKAQGQGPQGAEFRKAVRDRPADGSPWVGAW
jgi:hypothetical protein